LGSLWYFTASPILSCYSPNFDLPSTNLQQTSGHVALKCKAIFA
jgi:hypothetical protein